jgi:hypothetical protein
VNPVRKEFPTREDMAMELILRECGRDHDFPRLSLEITETMTDRDGHLVNVNRVACRKCGTLKVTRWRAPDPGTSPRSLAAIGTFERPQPADVPGIALRAALITEEEHAEFAAECGYPDGLPRGLAPDRRATAPEVRLQLTVRIRAGQLALIDRHRSLGEILPVPAAAESTDRIDAVPGAALFWTPVADGDLVLSVLIAPRAPASDPSYPSISEVSCRFHTGYTVLREIGGRTLDLPPLPAGHGDYRLRFQSGEAGGLLQIWPQPHGKPSAWGEDAGHPQQD